MAEAAGPRALPLHLAAQLAGCYRWMEHRLFELTGAWASEVPVPAVQVHLAEASRLHAWNAEQWAARLPVLDGVDPVALTRPLGAAPGALFGALDGAEPAGDGEGNGVGHGVVQRLAGLVRVALPRLVATDDHHLERAVPVTDGPTIHALRLVRRQDIELWEAGERLLQDLLRRPHDVEVAAAVQRRLESAVVATGQGPGLVAWPDVAPPG